MSATFGIIPLEEHPDRELLADIARLDAYHTRWESARTQRAKARLLKELRGDYELKRAMFQRLAATQARTMVGLIAKSDHALRGWRNDDGPDRYKRIWADMAMCLEQAMATLRSLNVMPEPVIVAADEDDG